MNFVTDNKTFEFLKKKNICFFCNYYCKSISFLVHNLNDVIIIYLRIDHHQHQKINKFSEIMNSFIKTQNLSSVFDNSHHDHFSAVLCYICDKFKLNHNSTTQKHNSSFFRDKKSNKRICLNAHKIII